MTRSYRMPPFVFARARFESTGASGGGADPRCGRRPTRKLSTPAPGAHRLGRRRWTQLTEAPESLGQFSSGAPRNTRRSISTPTTPCPPPLRALVGTSPSTTAAGRTRASPTAPRTTRTSSRLHSPPLLDPAPADPLTHLVRLYRKTEPLHYGSSGRSGIHRSLARLSAPRAAPGWGLEDGQGERRVHGAAG